MKKFLKSARGALAVFMGIIVIPLVTVTSVFIDSSKVVLARSLAESAGDLALNTVLTNFDKELNEYFGLIASAQDTTQAFDMAREFFVSSMLSQATEMEDSDGVRRITGAFSKDKAYSDFLGLQVKSGDVSVSALKDGSLANPALMKKQIVEFNKYRAPVNALAELYDFLTSSKKQIEELDDIADMTDKKTEFYEDESDLVDSLKKLRDRLLDYDSVNITEGYLKETREILKKDGNIYKFYDSLYEKIIYDFINVYDEKGNRLEHKQRNTLTEGDERPYYPTKTITVTDEEGNSSSQKIPDIEEAIRTCIGYCAAYKSNESNLVKTLFSNGLCDISGNNVVDIYSSKSGSIYDVQYWALAEQVLNKNNSIVDTFVTSYKLMTGYFKTLKTCYEKYMDLDADIKAAYSVNGSFNPKKGTYTNFNDNAGQVAYGNQDRTYIDHVNGIRNFITNVTKTGTGSTGNGANEYNIIVGNLNRIYSAITSGSSSYQKNGNIDKSAAEAKIQEYNKVLDERNTKLANGIEVIQYCLDIIEGKGWFTASLEDKLKDYETSYGKWNSAVSGLSGSDSELVEQNRQEIRNKESGVEKDDPNNILLSKIKVGDINQLKTRLMNVKNLLTEYQKGIKALKFCDKSIVDIEGVGDATKAVRAAIKGKGLESNSFYTDKIDKLKQAKSIETPNESSLEIKDGNHPELSRNEPTLRKEIYEFFKRQEQAKAESNLDEKSAKDKKKKFEEKSGNDKDDGADFETGSSTGASTVEIKDKPNLPSGTTTADSYASKSSDAGNVAETLGSLFADFAEGMRDDLLVTDYIMRMFSYDTFEKELLLDCAEDSGNAPKTMTEWDKKKSTFQEQLKNNMDKTSWNYNKNLRNIAINDSNGASYLNEVEYILYGGSNTSNKLAAYCYIYAIRFGCDLAPVFSQWYNDTVVTTLATSISSATLGVLPMPLVKVLICLALTCVEAGIDMAYIRNGFGIKFIKPKKELFCSFGTDDIGTGESEAGKACVGIGISKDGAFFRYSDYIQLFLLLKLMGNGESDVLKRTGDVIQVSMVKHNDEFLLTNSQVYFNLNATVSVKPLMLAQPINASSANPFKDLSEIVSFTYNVSRGY